MTERAPDIVAEAEEPVSLKRFLLAAVLWLPLAFFFWFWLRSVVVFPVIRLTRYALLAWMPELVTSVDQNFHLAEIETALLAEPQPGHEGRTGVIVLQANPLIYAYGLPVLVGLVMATPLEARRRWLQLLAGWAILIPLQALGLIGDVLKLVMFRTGEAGEAALAAHAISANVIALWYQFAYLILPAISPVVIWILFNRDFIEAIRRVVKEPGPGRAVRPMPFPERDA